MARIHTAGDGYTAPSPTSGWQWLPYPDEKRKLVVTRALHILRINVRGMRPCNHCFERLPGGRSFDDILDDPNVVISYDPGTTAGRYGVTRFAGSKDVSITEWTIRMGRWLVASTLVHEFAHVNGVTGPTHVAEGTLVCCGFAAHHNPSIIGVNNSGAPGPDSAYA